MTLPAAFQNTMQQKLGDAFSSFASSLKQSSPVSIRLNPYKPVLQPLSERPVPWSTFGRYLETRPIFTLDPHFHGGCYYVQEASSMFLEQVFKQVIDLDQQLTVLDLSAAPGGKSTHILSLLNNQSLLVSNETIRSRASILNENITKWGLTNCIVTNNDPQDFQALSGLFDVIVVDAPCSGEGLFRKDPAAIDEWSTDNVALCSSRQKRILSDVWPALKENGILIYCTCTYNEQENEENLVWLAREQEVEFIKLKTETSWGIDETSRQNVIGYRFYPHLVEGEGFFLSVVRKTQSLNSSKPRFKKNLVATSKRNLEAVRTWVGVPEQFEFLQHHEFIYMLPKEKMQDADIMSQHLSIVRAGTTIASVKHEKFIPDHGLAVNNNLQKENFNDLQLNYEDAIKYLRRDTLVPPAQSKGYYLITYENIPLGWINHLGNRVNNLYPQEWRIRMDPQQTTAGR